MKLPLAICLSVISCSLLATELKPWFGRLFEIEARGDCLMQAFARVDTEKGSVKRHEFDAFFNLGASAAIWETIAAQIEVIAMETRHRSGMNAVRLTGRYRWSNDIVGDPVSLTTGVTLSKIFRAARRNIATFDHGGVACEGHIAVGKEIPCRQFWTSRTWAVFGIGIADVGSPWLRGNLAWEHNWWDRHQVKLLAESIWGLGGNNLNLSHRFRGYGSIRYQAVDLSARYSYQFDNGLTVGIAYGYRVYAKNCPENVNLILLRVCYPFGL